MISEGNNSRATIIESGISGPSVHSGVPDRLLIICRPTSRIPVHGRDGNRRLSLQAIDNIVDHRFECLLRINKFTSYMLFDQGGNFFRKRTMCRSKAHRIDSTNSFGFAFLIREIPCGSIQCQVESDPRLHFRCAQFPDWEAATFVQYQNHKPWRYHSESGRYGKSGQRIRLGFIRFSSVYSVV